MLHTVQMVLDTASTLASLGPRRAAGAILGLALAFGLGWIRPPHTLAGLVTLVGLFFLSYAAGCLWDSCARKRHWRDLAA